jgi:hypothetical protein
MVNNYSCTCLSYASKFSRIVFFHSVILYFYPNSVELFSFQFTFYRFGHISHLTLTLESSNSLSLIRKREEREKKRKRRDLPKQQDSALQQVEYCQ